VPGYRVESWYGIYAPVGTPPEIVTKLNATITKAANTDEFRKKLEAEGVAISTGKPADLDDFVRAEEARWRRIVKQNNIKAD
jgi:tripartite-type tricarboxylate transporter receptor subunit TctC